MTTPTSDPVFLDRTGRRHRLVVLAGITGGLVLLLATAVLITAFTGTGAGAVPGWPAAEPGHADRVSPTARRTTPAAAPMETPRPARSATTPTRPGAPNAGATTAPPASSSAGPAISATASIPPGHRHTSSHSPNPRRPSKS